MEARVEPGLITYMPVEWTPIVVMYVSLSFVLSLILDFSTHQFSFG